MRSDDRKKLLGDYAVALVAERDLWERLHQPHLTEPERRQTLGEWKQVAASLKVLVRQLRDSPAEPPVVAAAAPLPPADDIAKDAARQEDFQPAGATAPAPIGANAFRPRARGAVLMATLRLVALWRTRLAAAIPSLGPH